MQAKRTLEFEDDDARPDVAALRHHLADCAACRAEYPEMEALWPRQASRAFSRLRIAAAALVLVAASAVLNEHAPPPSPIRTIPLATSTPTATRRSPSFTLTVRSTSIERDRTITSTWTRRSGLPANQSP